MAFISKEDKNAKATLLRALGKKYDIKLSVARHNYSTIVLNIYQGKIDFFSEYNLKDDSGYIQVNHYRINYDFCGESQEFLNECYRILNANNYNNSDSMIDYFDVGFYIDINIGKFNKPYEYIKPFYSLDCKKVKVVKGDKIDIMPMLSLSNICVDICGGGLNSKQVSNAMLLQRELMSTGSATKNNYTITLF